MEKTSEVFSEEQRQARYREATKRAVWLGFKAGSLVREGGPRQGCPFTVKSTLGAVWIAAHDVALDPEFFKKESATKPVELPAPASSVDEKLEAALNEIEHLAGRVVDLEDAVKVLQPAAEAKPPKKVKVKKAK